MLRSGDAARLPGTRIQNRCAVSSTGLDSIDTLMGGGLPTSTIYTITEENCNKYAPVLVKYFVAEGLRSKQDVFVAGPDLSADFLNELPACSTSHEVAQEPAAMANEKMKIAWRYSTMPAMSDGLSAKDKTRFDLARTLEHCPDSVETFDSSSYRVLWKKLVTLVEKADYTHPGGKKMLRILLLDVGTPLYEDPDQLESFLIQLRRLVLRANVLVMLPINESVWYETEAQLLLSLSDAYFKLEVHSEQTKKDLTLEDSYDGRFHIVKLPQLNSFATNKPECVDLVFEKHRHFFEIKTLRLPAVMGGSGVPPKSSCQQVADSF